MEIVQESFLLAGSIRPGRAMARNALNKRAIMAFNYADVDSKGYLCKREYEIAMTAVFGCRPDEMEMEQVFRSTDRISYEKFKSWVYEKRSAVCKVNAEVLFALLDRDYKGYLVLDDFYSASKFVNLKIPLAVWQMVFKELDRYKRGYIDFHEFLRILSTT
ncbi:PREDICTED: EF-hand calcium-binding domain-containing protein 11-like [Eufriesea mexicana]|uniref:EF-hand calcium-binding domain-containing protein 11-like n=1 Tax=Eufriesea mexicana TaxID=516756 RepID=UPI00083C754A|nr:PREDICTED: EF-hand calcium-binding domain-containing protein 11-like [Eufriesea mexicana]